MTTKRPAETVSNSRATLKSYVERLILLEEEKAEKAADIKALKAEIKGDGFDVKIITAIVKMHRTGLRGAYQTRSEVTQLLETYLSNLGWLPESEQLAAVSDHGANQNEATA